MMRWGSREPVEPRPGTVLAAGVFIAALWIIGATVAGEPALIATTDTLPPAVYVVHPVTEAVQASSPDVSAPGLASPGVAPASVTMSADRADSFLPLGPVSTLPPPVDGDCESWRPLLERFMIPFDEARPIMWRESRCSMAHNGNTSTRDDSWGPFQVNRWGSLAGWWDSGGYTAAVMATPEGSVAAAAVLYHSCRWSPWIKPYGCDGDYLATPWPEWGTW